MHSRRSRSNQEPRRSPREVAVGAGSASACTRATCRGAPCRQAAMVQKRCMAHEESAGSDTVGEAAVVTCPGKHWNLLHSPHFQNFPNSGCREGAEPGDPFVPPTPAPWSPLGSTKPCASAVQTAAGLFSADRQQLYSMSLSAAFQWSLPERGPSLAGGTLFFLIFQLVGRPVALPALSISIA